MAAPGPTRTYSTLLLLIFTLVLSVGACPAQESSDTDRKSAANSLDLDAAKTQLRERGIATDRTGLLTFLRKLGFHEDRERELKGLVLQLGAEKFSQRESAQQRLSEIGFVARGALLEEFSNADPEIRSRAREILKGFDHKAVATDIHHAALLLVQDPSTEVFVTLLNLQPAADSWTRAYLGQLLYEVVKPEHRELLEEMKTHSKTAIREAAIIVSQRLLEEGDHSPLLKLLEDPNPRIRFAAAKALGNAGDPRCLPILLDLLKTENARFFDEVDGALASLTGHNIIAVGNEQRRFLWLTWLEESADDKIKLFSAFTFFNENFLRHANWKLIPGSGASLKPSTWTFLPEGVLRRTTQNGNTTDKDTWELKGSKLVVVINDYATYTAHVARPDRIEGSATNIKNKKWTWHCERLSAAPEPPEAKK